MSQDESRSNPGGRAVKPRDGAPDPDTARGGFGSRRWTGPGETHPAAGEIAPTAPPRAASEFGAPRWRAPVAAGDDSDLFAAEDEAAGQEDERAPRRRRGPVPSPHPRRTMAALGAAVRIVRDAGSVPHVSARSERDAYAALGYCMAGDRLWQMDLFRRLATGRAAEVLGSPLKRHDALVRTMGVARRGTAAATLLSGVARDALASFTSGVNACRAEHRPRECELLGYEIEPWTIADSLAVELLAAWSSALRVWTAKLLLGRVIVGAGLERARWVSPVPLDLEVAGEERSTAWRQIDPRLLELGLDLPLDLTPGGVAWAIPGARSQSGAALVAGALHLSPVLPAPAYLAHLEAPGFSVAGATRIGTPVFPLGRNRHCAWASCATDIDDADAVLEELDGIGNYQTEAGWSKLAVRRELIRVRDGESFQLEVAETRNGPLLSRLVQQLDGRGADARLPAVAVRWGVQSLGSAVPGWLALARARSLEDVGRAAALLDHGPLAIELVGGDSSGAVGRWTAGGQPLREGRAPLPVRGWCAEGAWKGVQRLSSAAHSASATDAVPLAAGSEGPAERAAWSAVRRARELVSTAAKLGADDCAAMLLDTVDVSARELLPLFHGALAGMDAAAAGAAEAASLIRAWDGEAAADSAGAALFYVAMLHVLPRELFPESRFGPLARHGGLTWPAVARILAADSSPWFADPTARDRALGSALARAAMWLASELGPEPQRWSWGALHPLAVAHPLASSHDAIAASALAVCPASGSPGSVLEHGFSRLEPPFAVTRAPVARMVADLATDETRLALASGQSGQCGGADLVDPVEAFRAGRSTAIGLTGQPSGDLSELVPG